MSKPLTLLTGANSGVGLATAKLFASKNVPLILACRTSEKATMLLKQHNLDATPADVNLASFDSTIEGAETVADIATKTGAKELVLLHNAGSLIKDRRITADGVEESLQVNFISPVLLSFLVAKHLPQTPIRHVFVSTGSYKTSNVNWNDLEYAQKYNGWYAYIQAKRMQVILTRLLAKDDDKLNNLIGVKQISKWVTLDPGWIKTKLVRPDNGWSDADYQKMMGGAKTTPEQAAETLWFAAMDPSVNSGDFIARGRAQKVIPDVDNKAEQEKLWNFVKSSKFPL